MNTYAAGIVLYNPDIDRLKENIESIYKQVRTVYCYDNNSANIKQIQKLVSNYNNVILINNDSNEGIAITINKMAKIAIKHGITWLLTLDQDSICPKQMIEKFSHYTDVIDVGIICPYMIDKRRPSIEKPKSSISYVNFCITSGSFMNLNIFEKLRGLDEILFIGMIDDDYCYRLRLNGYKILQVNETILDHELGDLTPSKHAQIFIKLGEFIHSNKIKALSYKRKVSSMRVYYATRNIIYLSRKYKKNPVYKFSLKFAVKNGISNILRSNNKFVISKAFIEGIIDGKKMEK